MGKGNDGRYEVKDLSKFREHVKTVSKKRKENLITPEQETEALATLAKILAFGHFYKAEYARIMSIVNLPSPKVETFKPVAVAKVLPKKEKQGTVAKLKAKVLACFP